MNFPTVCESGAESGAECGANFTLVFLHTGNNHETKILFFSQKNRIFLEMTVKTSQENKEFWRKTKFLHIFPSAASNQNFSTHLVGPPPYQVGPPSYQVGPPYSCVWPSKVSREVAMATCQ